MTKIERLFVWTGGALFVSALAACAYEYIALWARPVASGGAGRALIVDATLFSAFALHHSVLARESIKQRLARLVPERLLRSVYVWVASLLLLLVLGAWQPIAGSWYEAHGWLAVIHALVQLLGVGLIARSVAKIDALELAGITPETERGPLQISGPYRLVRHPLYLGWIIALFGTAHFTSDRLAFAVISTVYLALAIPWEERSLVKTFGEAYTKYQRDVRWRVIPFVY